MLYWSCAEFLSGQGPTVMVSLSAPWDSGGGALAKQAAANWPARPWFGQGRKLKPLFHFPQMILPCRPHSESAPSPDLSMAFGCCACSVFVDIIE